MRKPTSIGRSLQRRDGFPASAAILLWQVYLTSILRDLPPDAKVLFVSYEQLLSDPQAICGRLIEFLRFSAGLSDRQCVKAKWLGRFVRHELCHSDAEVDDLFLDDAQQGLYRHLVELTQDSAVRRGAASLSYPVFPGWRDYLQLWDRVLAFALQEDRKRFRFFPESNASLELRSAVRRGC